LGRRPLGSIAALVQAFLFYKWMVAAIQATRHDSDCRLREDRRLRLLCGSNIRSSSFSSWSLPACWVGAYGLAFRAVGCRSRSYRRFLLRVGRFLRYEEATQASNRTRPALRSRSPGLQVAFRPVGHGSDRRRPRPVDICLWFLISIGSSRDGL